MTRGLPDWAQRRFDPTQRYGLRITLFALAAILVAVPFSFLLLQVLSAGPVTQVDQSIAEAINAWIHESEVLVGLSFFLSFLGSPVWFYVTIGLSAYWFLRKGYWRVAVFMAATPLIGGAISTVVKILVDRPRPQLDEPIAEALGKSFPSGHAMAATVGYGTLLLAFLPLLPSPWKPRAIAAYVAIVVSISASRLGLGVHYLSDVLGGIALGAAWLCVSVAIFRIWRREQRKPVADVDDGIEPEVANTA